MVYAVQLVLSVQLTAKVEVLVEDTLWSLVHQRPKSQYPNTTASCNYQTSAQNHCLALTWCI